MKPLQGPGSTVSPATRFWRKVKKGEGCWEWQASTCHGYGQFGVVTGEIMRAHRAAWALTYGPVPAGQYVCHRCDNRRCVRPSHLFLGTQADNLADMTKKGRRIKDTTHPNTIVPLAEVAVMREKAARGISARALSQEYGVSHFHIYKILRGAARI